VAITLAFGCLTNDVVCEYAFAKNDNLVGSSKEFQTDIHDALVNVSEVGHILKQVPWLMGAMKKVPLWVRNLSRMLEFIVLIFTITDDQDVRRENTIVHRVSECEYQQSNRTAC